MVLQDVDPCSQGDLVGVSLLPDRTVGYAAIRLQTAGLVEARYSFEDARKGVYFHST